MADDIVDLLRMGSTGCNCGAWSYSECGCNEAQWSEMYIDAAADEIERLRTQVEFAHNILGSQTMVWVFHGSEGWQQTNLRHLREPIHEYWEKYGNSFSEVHNESLTTKHMKHYRNCNCLGHGDKCCNPNCECHQSKENNND